MATTEVDTAEATPLTTMQKMEVVDKELLTSEYDQKADQLSKDELKNIEIELTKALETVEQSGDGDTGNTQVHNEARVREFDTGAQENDGVLEGGILKIASFPEVAEERIFTEHVDTVNAENDELRVYGKLEEIDKSSIVEKGIEGTEEKGEALPCPGNVDKGTSKADERGGSQFDEQVPSEVGQTPSDTVEVETQAVANDSSNDIEERKMVSVPGEQEKDAIVKPTGEISIPESQVELFSESGSVPNAPHDEDDLEPAKEEGIIKDLSTSKTDIDDAERKTNVEVPATSTDSLHEQEKVPDILIQSEDGVHIQAKETKTEDTRTDSIQPEKDLDEAEALDIADKIIIDAEEEITIKEQHTKEADKNFAELATANEMDTTPLILEVTEKAEVESPTKEGEKTIPAESKQRNEISTGRHESLVDDAEVPETVEEKDKVSLSEELETGHLNSPELEKTQEADTIHTSIEKDTNAETIDDVQVTEDPENAVEGFQASTDSKEGKNEHEPSPTSNVEQLLQEKENIYEQTSAEENEDEPSPSSNVKQLLEDEENKPEAIIKEVNDQHGSTSIDGSVEEQTNIVGHLSTESHEEGVTVVSQEDEKKDSNNKEISEHITQVTETKPEKSTSENDKPEVEVPESSSIFTSETPEPEELVATDDAIGVRVTTAEEEADKIEEQGSDTRNYKASDAESTREMNFVLTETSEKTGVTEAEILDKDADVKEILLAPHEGLTDNADEVVIPKEENDEEPATSKTADMTSAKGTYETEEIGELTSEKIIEHERPHAIDSRQICTVEDGEIMKDENTEISERDDMISHSLTETADDSSSELPSLAESSQKETPLGEKGDEKIVQIDETPETIETEPDVIPVVIEKNLPVDNGEKSTSLDVKEPDEDVAHIVETCKVEDDKNVEIIEKDDTNNSPLTVTADASSSLTVTADDCSSELPLPVDSKQKETSVYEEDDEKTIQTDETPELVEQLPAIPAEIEDVPAKDEDNSTSLHVEEPVQNDAQIADTCNVEDDKTNKVENIEITEIDDTNNSSFAVTTEDGSSDLPVESNQKKTSLNEEDEKTAYIDEPPEIAEPIPVVIPAEIEKHVPEKYEEKSTSLNVEEPVENVVQIVQAPKEDLKNESEVVDEQLPLVSGGDTSGDVDDSTEEKLDAGEQSVTLEAKDAETGDNKEESATTEDSLICQPSEHSESAEGNSIDKTVEESTAGDATKLDEFIEKESPIETNDSQEASKQVEQTEEMGSLDQTEIQVEKELEVVAEPDPDASETLEKLSEPDPEEAHKLNQVAEPDPDIIPAEIEKDVPADDENKSMSLDLKEPVEYVAQNVETCKIEDDEKIEIIEKEDTNNSSLTVTADDSISELPVPVDSKQKETSVNKEDDEKTVQINETPELVELVSPAEIEDVPAKDVDNSSSLNVEDHVQYVAHIVETCKVEDEETNEVEKIEISETEDTNNSSFTIPADDNSFELPAESNQKETSLHEEDEKTAHIDESADIAELIPVVIPAEIEEDVPSKDEEKSKSLNVEEPVKNVAQIVQTPKEDLKNESESEVVNEQLTVVSREDASGDVADTTEEKLDVVEKSVTLEAKEAGTGDNKEESATIEPSEQSERTEDNTIGKTDEESTAEDATKLDELIETEIQVEKELEVIAEAEPDPDASEKLEKLSEPDPEEAQKLKQVAEPDSGESQNLERISEPDPDDSEKLKVSEPDPNETEILKQVPEPHPDEAENLKISEPTSDDSENLKNASERPHHDNQEMADKTEVTEDYEEVANTDYPVDTSEEILEYTDKQAIETAVSNEVVAVSVLDTAPERSVEDSVHEEVSSIQTPELRTEEKSEPKKIVVSQTTQEPIKESDVEHIDITKTSQPSKDYIIKEVEGAGLSPPVDASATDIKPCEEKDNNINKEEEIESVAENVNKGDFEIPLTDVPKEEIESVAENVNKGDFEIPLTDVPEVGKQDVEYEMLKDEAGQDVTLQDREPGKELKNLPHEAEVPELPSTSANDGEITILESKEVTGEVLEEEKPKDEIEDDGSVKEKMTVNEVLAKPDGQGEEIEHLSSKAEDFELATSIVNDENISSLKREDVTAEVLERQKDDASAENNAKEVLKPEDEQEVTKYVQNETEDSELSTSSVSVEKLPGEQEPEAVTQHRRKKDGPKDDDDVEEKSTTNEVFVQGGKQAQPDQIPFDFAESESSPSSLNNEDTTIHEREKAPEEDQEKLSVENQPEDEQEVIETSEISNSSVNDDKLRGKGALEAVPEGGKEKDARKDEQGRPDPLPNEQALIDRFKNELEDNESSVPSLNNEDTATLEHGQNPEENQEKLSAKNPPENEDKVAETEIAQGAVDEQGAESVLINLPIAAENTENQIQASCVDDDYFTALKAGEAKEEGKEKNQAQENDTVQETEAATEVIMQEDEQGEQLKRSYCADKENESSTSIPDVNDDGTTIPKKDISPGIVIEDDQATNEDVKERETIIEELVQESKGVELKHSQNESGEAETRDRDDMTTVPKSNEEPKENLHGEKVADLVNGETEEKERAKETLSQQDERGQLGHLSGVCGNLERSVPYSDDNYQTSQTSKEAQEEESPNDHVEIDEIKEDKLSAGETEQAEYNININKRETANEVFEQEISQEDEIDLPNMIVKAESSIATASVDETVILRGQDPEKEEQKKGQDLGFATEELEPDTIENTNKLKSKEPESVEGNANKEDSTLEDSISQAALENKVERNISEIEKSNTVYQGTLITDETEIIDKLHETSVEKVIDEDVTLSEVLPSADDKYCDEDGKGLTETGAHEIDKLESLPSVGVPKETAKEAKEETLENITQVANEGDKKDLIYTENQEDILQGSEGNDVLTQSDKNDYTNDLFTTISDENNLQTVEVPTPAADAQVDKIPKETVDEVPPESLELQDIETFNEGQKKLIFSEPELTEKVYVHSESPVSSSILQEEKGIPKKDTETTIPSDISLMENAVKIEDFADKEPQTAEEDEIHIEDNTCAGSAVVEKVEISGSISDRDEEIKQKLKGDGFLETIEEKSSLGLEDATLATSEIPVNEKVPEEYAATLESGSIIIEQIKKENTIMMEIHSDSTEKTSYNEGKNHDPLSLSLKPEKVDVADVVEIREALKEQNSQENYIENITLNAHEAKPEERNQNEEQQDDSPSETMIEPVKLQELEADNNRDEKTEGVENIELDKEESNTHIETHSNSPKDVDVKEMQFQEIMTVVTDGAKLTIDQSTKSEVLDKIPEETKVCTESPHVSVREVYAGEGPQINETLTEELTKELPEDKTGETKGTGATEYLGESKDEGIQDLNTKDVKGNEIEEHSLDKAAGSSKNDAPIKVNLTDREAPKVDGTPSEQVEASEISPVECRSIEGGREGTTYNGPVVLASIKDDSKLSSETEISSNTCDNKDGDFQGNDSNLATMKPELNTSKAISGEVFNAEENPRKDPAPSTSINNIPRENKQSTTRSLNYEDVVRPESTIGEKDEVKMRPENSGFKKTTQEIEKEIEIHNPLGIPAENSLNDLLQISTKDTIQMTRESNKDTNQTAKKETIRSEDPETDEDKDDEEEEEGEEHKKTDSSSDGVIVEASRDMDVKSPQKKHHRILSGVGLKVKNSISKVKKAITGKSSHTKPPSPK